MAGWGTSKVWHHRSEFGLMAPPLNWPPIHTKKVYTFHPVGQNSGVEGQKRARGYLSPEIGGRWRLSRVDFHSHCWSIAIPP